MSQPLPALGIDVGGGSAKIGIVSPAGIVLAEDVVTSDQRVIAPVLIDRYLATAEKLQKSLEIEKLCVPLRPPRLCVFSALVPWLLCC